MATTPEGKVKRKVKEYLKSIGMGRSGCPDILVCFNGKFFAFETKAPGKINNVTPNQQREIEEIIRANGSAHVVDSVDQVKVIMES